MTVAERVEAVRHFNRFYTRVIGVLREGLLDSPFSLVQARVLYELAHRDQPTASEIARDLGLDAGYLSRILRGFAASGLVRRRRSSADGRRTLLELTARGRRTFRGLDQRSQADVRAMLRDRSPADQQRLLAGMRGIERALGRRVESSAPYVIRPPQPGDMGWVVHRHGLLYAQEYGYDEQFEALVARIVADFVDHFDPRRERCWIAERDGEIVGSVFLVRKSATVAKLRLLLVEPAARGLGIGGRLLRECVAFARLAGYRKITLWTQNDLYAARHLYKRAGFHIVGKEAHQSFGKDLVAETWELDLAGTRP
jgi:DNA-binding MarR family transcriptional regulator/GNAT superfamily N-acetyltransferase